MNIWKSLCAYRSTKKRQSHRGRRLLCEKLEPRQLLTTLSLTPIADNTLYEDPTGNLSNALGQFLYVGDTNQALNHTRRAVLKFDFSELPAGSLITGAALRLNMSRSNDPVPQVTALRRLLGDWGEGTSNAGGGALGEGAGTQATAGDATWRYKFFSTEFWATPGGDFVPEPSAATPVGGVGQYFWTSGGMAADIQQWVNLPASNFGWILTGNETNLGTARQFDSKDNAVPENRPLLTIEFTPPSPDMTVAKSHTPARFRQGDPDERYTITVSNRGSLPTTGVVTVTDTLPSGLTPTAANNRVINGWNVTVSGQTVIATRDDVINPGGTYAPLPIIVAVSPTAPTRVTNIVTVAGGGELNTTNNSASDPTNITPMPDLLITKTHTGNFLQGQRGATYTITVTNVGDANKAVGRVVSVRDLLPQGLVATALRGRGWTTNLRTLTATRRDVLRPDASYSPLTLTVRVGANAPASVTNTARVSGGGQLNTANDTANDPTTILPAGAVSVISVSPADLAAFSLAASPTDQRVASLPSPLRLALASSATSGDPPAAAVDQAMAVVAVWTPAAVSDAANVVARPNLAAPASTESQTQEGQTSDTGPLDALSGGSTVAKLPLNGLLSEGQDRIGPG